jgi:hypothetical protein
MSRIAGRETWLVGSGVPGPRAERGVLDCTGSELFQSQVQMAFVHRNEIIQTLPANGANELLAVGIRRGMSGDITMQYPSRSDLHRHEDVQKSEGQRDGDEGITGENHVGLIANVAQHWSLFAPFGRPRRLRYLPTVRGETRIPNLTFSSLAISSSPQVGFSQAICPISVCRFLPRCGRPDLRDFHFQNSRKAVRCHLINVSGLTMTGVSRQWNNLDSKRITVRSHC